MRHAVVFAAIALSASRTQAQANKLPITPLGPIEAKSTEPLGALISLRALPDGGALVIDATKRKLLAFDASLTNVRVVMDSAQMSTSPMSVLSMGLIRYNGDSSLMIDPTSQSLLVLDASGKTARVMAVPKPTDIFYIGGNPQFGTPGFDALGRLIYKGQYVPTRPPQMNPTGPTTLPGQPDSAPVVRADFDKRTVDTLGTMKMAVQVKSQIVTPGATPTSMPSVKAVINPAAAGDEWAVLSDGTVAVVRAQDYHIDWIDSDGTKRSSPKMPFDWRRMSDADKQLAIDTTKRMLDSAMKASPALPNGQRMSIEFDFVPAAELPDYHPPIRAGSVKADLDNHLWILPTTSSDSKDGFVYDVVSREGQVVQRVKLPPNAVITGFGKGGIVFLMVRVESTSTWQLARARVPAPK